MSIKMATETFKHLSSDCDICPAASLCPRDQFLGIGEKQVKALSAYKNEPQWMLDCRLEALDLFQKLSVPSWGPDLSEINFEQICYFLSPNSSQKINTEKLHEKYFAGVNAQLESELVYQNLKNQWEEKGVIFCDLHTAIERYPNLVKKYFGTVVKSKEHKFTALNSAIWSGGNFIYIPAGVKLDMPLQAFFQINSPHFGQFERSIIVLEEDSCLDYLEGCSAGKGMNGSLHAGVVEIFVGKGAKLKYTTFQRWSDQVYNLVTKRAILEEKSQIEWIDGNFGSKTTMKYPGIILSGDGAKAEVYSISVAGNGQNQDFGNNIWYKASNCTVRVESKAIAKNGGISATRNSVKSDSGLKNNKGSFNCSAILINPLSKVKTIPRMSMLGENCQLIHEAKVGKVDMERIQYLMSKGIPLKKAEKILISGFFESIASKLPSEYAVELERFIN